MSSFICHRFQKWKWLNPKKGGGLELPGRVGGGADSAPPCENCFSDCFCQFFPYHPSNVYTMKVHVAWEHSSFKNVDLVAIQSFDPQAQIFNLSIFGKIWYFPSIKNWIQQIKPEIFLLMITNESLLVAKYFVSWSKILKK